MDTHRANIGQCLAELRGRAQARIGLVLRITSIDATDVPAENFKSSNAVFLGIGR